MKILDLAIKDDLNPKKVASTNGGEYHSPCPSCGGIDRFIIWPITNRYYCRRCGKTGDAIQYLRDFHQLSFKDACLKANITINSNTKTYIKKTNVFNSLNNPPDIQWQLKGQNFINNCNQKLLTQPKALLLLENRGFSLKTIEQFQLGFNPESIQEDWSLDNSNRKIWIPKGIVIPSFFKVQLYKIKVRRNDWHSNDSLPKYIEIHGSYPAPAIYGNNYKLPIIILESELDAMLIQQEASDLCLSLALGGATKKPDSYIHSLLIKAPIVIFSLDFDEAGINAYKWWKKNYNNLFVWIVPFEKSVGDAFLKNLNIREWLLLGLKKFNE